MTSTSVWSSRLGRIAVRNGFLASALNVTALVSIFVAIFAVVTQLLAANGEISLSTTMQLTMWLVALGFIVLLAIAYMFFRAFEPVSPVQEHNDTQGGTGLGRDAGSPGNPTDGPPQFRPRWSPDGSALKADDAWVPPDELRRLYGSEDDVSTEDVFPDGCYLDSITPVPDAPAGQWVYVCRVVDRNPDLKGRPHETEVEIVASQELSLASMPRFGWVEFEDLTITPYLTDRNPMWIRYSLRATGLRAAAPTGREQATWIVPPSRGVPPDASA